MKKGHNREVEKYFIDLNNCSECNRLFDKVIATGIDFKVGKNTKRPVLDYKSFDRIKKDLLEPIPQNSKNFDAVLSEFSEKILDGSMNFSSPNFIGFPDCGNSIAGVAGHILSAMLNQNLINSQKTAPTATFAEIAVINWLRELIGYDVIENQQSIFDVGGINVTGGVLANTVGLLLARENKLKGTLENGLSVNPSKLKVFCPKGIGHYSIKAALGWLGLGHQSYIETETTPDFTINQEDLIKKLDDLTSDEIPIAIVAYTGDSRTMAIDDFVGLAKIAKQYDTWFHIDACHGASLCFSDKLKKKVKGINLADSVTIDPHKVLFIPYNLSYILVKDPKKFELVAGVSDLITNEDYSFGQITPFLGSRGFNSLKLWFLIKHLGRKKIGSFIEKRHEMAKKLENFIQNEPDFCMINKVTINSAVFLFIPKKLKQELSFAEKKEEIIKKVNTLNLRIQDRLFKEGNYYVHTFLLNDFRNMLKTGPKTVLQVLRVMIGNPVTDEKILKELLLDIRRIGKEETLNLGY